MARRRSKRLVAVASALLAALVLATPAEAISLGPESAHSPNAEDISTSYWVMLILVALALVVFQGALIVAALRFRARRARRPRRFAAARGALRPAIAGLSLIAMAVFVFGVTMTSEVRDVEPTGPGGLAAAQTAQVGVKGVPPAAALEGAESVTGEEPVAEAGQGAPLEIGAIAQQWLWRFEYPGHQPSSPIFSYGELVVPVDTAVLLSIDSTDVLHSWWVPALGGQVQATPGEVTQTWFRADEEGRYAGRSTVFSGTAYPALRAWVRVVSPPEYEAYVDGLADDLAAAQGEVQARIDAAEEAGTFEEGTPP